MNNRPELMICVSFDMCFQSFHICCQNVVSVALVVSEIQASTSMFTLSSVKGDRQKADTGRTQVSTFVCTIADSIKN